MSIQYPTFKSFLELVEVVKKLVSRNNEFEKKFASVSYGIESVNDRFDTFEK